MITKRIQILYPVLLAALALALSTADARTSNPVNQSRAYSSDKNEGRFNVESTLRTQ